MTETTNRLFSFCMSKGEQTRQRIIETAAELFWGKGYHVVSVADFTEAANINKATMYHHFKSKEELGIAVVRQMRDWAVETIFERAFREVEAPDARLKRIYEISAENRVSTQDRCGRIRGCPFIKSGLEHIESSEPIRNEVQQSFAVFETYYRRIIEALRPDTTDAAVIDRTAAALVRNMHGAMVASEIEQRPGVIMDAYESAKLLAGATA